MVLFRSMLDGNGGKAEELLVHSTVKVVEVKGWDEGEKKRGRQAI